MDFDKFDLIYFASALVCYGLAAVSAIWGWDWLPFSKSALLVKDEKMHPVGTTTREEWKAYLGVQYGYLFFTAILLQGILGHAFSYPPYMPLVFMALAFLLTAFIVWRANIRHRRFEMARYLRDDGHWRENSRLPERFHDRPRR